MHRPAQKWSAREGKLGMSHSASGRASGSASGSAEFVCPIDFVRQVHLSFGFFDPTMPPKIQQHIDTLKARNPDFQVRVWGPDESLALMRAAFPDLVATYLGMPYAIQRSDMSRYAILAVHGGVYADLDYDFTKPLAQVLCVAYGLKDGGAHAFVNATPNASKLRRRASNSFMGARAPGHPFWEYVLAAVNKGWGASKRQVVLSSAGPQAVDRALKAWRSAHKNSMADVVLLPTDRFNPCSICDRNSLGTSRDPRVLAVHINGGSWHSADTCVTNTLFCDWPWALATGLLFVAMLTFLILWVRLYTKTARRHRQ